VAKILVVHPGPDFSVADVYHGWLKALRKSGHQISTYNTNERLTFYGRALFEEPASVPCEHGRQEVRRAVKDGAGIAALATKGLLEECFLNPPDVVFFISAFFQPGDALQAIKDHGIKIVMLHTESPYQDTEQQLRGAYSDLNLLNDPINIQSWRDLGMPVAYVPHSYDPDVHFPVYPRQPSIDFAFVGTSFLSRCEFFSAMNFDGLDVVLGGNAWDQIDAKFYGLYKYLGHQPDTCVDNTEAARVYRMARTGINFYRREGEDEHQGEGYSMGPREVEMAACGLFFLRDPRPESDEVFPMLPTFDGPQDAEEKLRWYCSHERERDDLADQANMAIADWTFTNRAKQVMHLMEEFGIV
jgi:spore maturation protein CgeB